MEKCPNLLFVYHISTVSVKLCKGSLTALLHEAAGVRVQGAGQLQWSHDELSPGSGRRCDTFGKSWATTLTTFPPVR